MKFMMCEIMYVDNTPFPPLLRITPVLPVYTQSIFLSEATAQWSLIPSTLHPCFSLCNRLYATHDIWKPHPAVGRAGCTP